MWHLRLLVSAICLAFLTDPVWGQGRLERVREAQAEGKISSRAQALAFLKQRAERD